MSQRDLAAVRGRGNAMTVIAQQTSIDTVAVEAVRLGRRLAKDLPDAAIDAPDAFIHSVSGTLARLEAGDVFALQDDPALASMLTAICQTLDGFRAGYGDYFMRECTAEHPFYDVDQDRVRRLGEVLKAFLEARQTVIDTVIAERELTKLRRR